MVMMLQGVMEVSGFGVPVERSGESVNIVVGKKDPSRGEVAFASVEELTAQIAADVVAARGVLS